MSLDLWIQEAVATLRINRPHQRNAFSREMWRELKSACEEVGDNSQIRVLAVEATEGAFSSGGDFDDFASLSSLTERKEYMEEVLAAYNAYENLPIPTVAVVDGIAVGGGCELAIVSDIVVATENARFGLPEARVGLYPGVAVSRGRGRISPRFLDYLIYTGRLTDAVEAQTGGIVTTVCESGELEEVLASLLSDICTKAPLALRAAKKAAIDYHASGGYEVAARDIPILMTTSDHTEGLKAFGDGRLPNFEGS